MTPYSLLPDGGDFRGDEHSPPSSACRFDGRLGGHPETELLCEPTAYRRGSPVLPGHFPLGADEGVGEGGHLPGKWGSLQEARDDLIKNIVLTLI